MGRDERNRLEEATGVNASGPGADEAGRGGILERILGRLAPAEVVEGVLGDLEESRGERPARGAAARLRYGAEALHLMVSLAHERLGRFLHDPGFGSLGERGEVLMSRMRNDGADGVLWLVGRWLLASLAGWAAGLAAAVLLSAAGEALVGLNSDRFLAFAALGCLGIGVGLAQSRVIGPLLPRPRNWVWATAAGHFAAMIALLVPWFRRFSGPAIVGNTAMLVLIGAVIGGMQWWILRRRFRGAGLWPLATALGFVSFVWIILNPVSTTVGFVLANAAMGVAANILPGALLAWFITQQALGATPNRAAAVRP